MPRQFAPTTHKKRVRETVGRMPRALADVFDPGKAHYDRFSAAQALYWYLAEHHAGQGSKEYRLLSQLEYRPGGSERGPEDGEPMEIHAKLERREIDPSDLLDYINQRENPRRRNVNPEDIFKPLGPGKFRSKADEIAWEASQDGVDEESGDLSEEGYWRGLMLDTNGFASIHPQLGEYEGLIVFEDDRGFVEVDYFKRAADAKREWREHEEADEKYGRPEGSEDDE